MPALTPSIEILLVEDNPADVRLTREAFRETRVATRLVVARDGVEAMELLLRARATHALPDLVLLDLNLPRMDGREVLAAIRQHDDLCHLPVIILTTSSADQDVTRSYRLGANAFIAKPVDVDHFFQMVKALENFWLNLVRLPKPTW